jgi:hypothetical protein
MHLTKRCSTHDGLGRLRRTIAHVHSAFSGSIKSMGFPKMIVITHHLDLSSDPSLLPAAVHINIPPELLSRPLHRPSSWHLPRKQSMFKLFSWKAKSSPLRARTEVCIHSSLALIYLTPFWIYFLTKYAHVILDAHPPSPTVTNPN